MSEQVIATRPVQVVAAGEPQQREVALAIFTGLNYRTTVFGLTDYLYAGKMTSLCYDTSLFRPESILDHARSERGGWFYFEDGLSEIRIEADELERAFNDLGLMNRKGATS